MRTPPWGEDHPKTLGCSHQASSIKRSQLFGGNPSAFPSKFRPPIEVTTEFHGLVFRLQKEEKNVTTLNPYLLNAIHTFYILSPSVCLVCHGVSIKSSSFLATCPLFLSVKSSKTKTWCNSVQRSKIMGKIMATSANSPCLRVFPRKPAMESPAA